MSDFDRTCAAEFDGNGGIIAGLGGETWKLIIN